MKKIISIISLIVVTILIGVLFIADVKKNQDINIENDNLMWNLYDINIQEIKQNMDLIMESNSEFKWHSLKDINTKDKEYEKLLNEISKKVTNCYYNFENDGSSYTDNNYAKKYRNSKSISKEEINTLKYLSTYNCANSFKYYKEVELNINIENKEILINKIDEVLEFEDKYLIKKPKNYNEFLYNEIVETEILKNMSKFLSDEYYRLK